MSYELPEGATPRWRDSSASTSYRSGTDWEKYSNFANTVLGPFTGQRKAGDGLSEYYRELARRPFSASSRSGRSETLGDGSLTALFPDSFEPIVFPGGGGGAVGGKSTGQRLAGAATGALSGAAAGSKILPGWGTAIGAGLGALGGLFG